MPGLNIKNEAVVGRIRQLARQRKQTLTGAIDALVVKALEEDRPADGKLDVRTMTDDEFEAWLAERRPKGPLMTDKELDALLYDEDGLPK